MLYWKKCWSLWVAVCVMLLLVNAGQAKTFNFSVDLGSDRDFSDPNADGDEILDCGDVYTEKTPDPVLIKNDTNGGPNTGYPYASAPQPVHTLIGNVLPANVEAQYGSYFDLDGDDQIHFVLPNYNGNVVSFLSQNRPLGVYYEPTNIYLSFEDDGPNGWANSGDVPVTALRDDPNEIYLDTGNFWNGANMSWSPPTLAVERTETQLGLAPAPGTQAEDDDVDALDTEQHRYWYWSPDHEANMGDDPGSIYLTDKQATGVNKTQVIDDYNATGWRLSNKASHEEMDVDAFEFVAIGFDTYIDIFGDQPLGANPGDEILCVLFSVDGDDADTTNFNDLYGDESGGLNPNTVYISNMLGNYIEMATYNDDIDAITVPEPCTLTLLGFSGLGLLIRRKRRTA